MEDKGMERTIMGTLWNWGINVLDWIDDKLGHPYYPVCRWIAEHWKCDSCNRRWVNCFKEGHN